MPTFFRHSGSIYQITSPEDAASIVDLLPGGVFTLKVDMFGGFYLEEEPMFKLPPKLYGETAAQAERIWGTFQKRPLSTGALFSGLKGSGKTLLMKVLAVKAAALGVPTIIINEPHRGVGFNQFIQSIEQEAIIVFDEFEKVYAKQDKDDVKDPQEGLLSLLDGIYSNSKKLFLFTSNSTWSLSNFLKNRPSRVWYHFKFEGLTPDFVREYGEDKLDNKARVPSLVAFARLVGQFNFDLLQALVEEMNLYNESVAESTRYLNIDIEDNVITYEPESITHEKWFPVIEDDDFEVNINFARPFFSFSVFVEPKKPGPRKKKGEAAMPHYLKFSNDDIIDVRPGGEGLTLKNEQGFTLTLRREAKKASVDMRKAFYDEEEPSPL